MGVAGPSSLFPSVFSCPVPSVCSRLTFRPLDSSLASRSGASGDPPDWTDRVAVRMGSVGIDLLEIERLERALARRPRLATRLFTAQERAYAAARPHPAMHLAARF